MGWESKTFHASYYNMLSVAVVQDFTTEMSNLFLTARYKYEDYLCNIIGNLISGFWTFVRQNKQLGLEDTVRDKTSRQCFLDLTGAPETVSTKRGTNSSKNASNSF